MSVCAIPPPRARVIDLKYIKLSLDAGRPAPSIPRHAGVVSDRAEREREKETACMCVYI